MKKFFPVTGTESEWNEAYYRLEDYLRSLHVVNKVHQSQIILRLLQAAAVRHAENPEQNPTELAMQAARQATEEWFENLLARREGTSTVGLISLLATDASTRWPAAFLSETVPPECIQELRDSDVRAGPDLRVSSMVPRPIDVGPLLDVVVPVQRMDPWERGLAATALLVAMGVLAEIVMLVLH